MKTMISWLCDPEVHFRGREADEPPPKIVGCRRAEHADLPSLERLIRTKTYEIFGDIELARIYETSCVALVQYNEKHDVVSGMCVCNYPNVPPVPSQDWLTWLKKLYGVENVTEWNTVFVHFLAWDERYTTVFFEGLLTELFQQTVYCLHVILVLPPRVIPADVLDQQMIRILPKDIHDTDNVQSLYVTRRFLSNPRLKVRRVVEEDNDDVIPIIDDETTALKELYGEYYISEMVRFPDDCRRLIVSEDDEGLATGVMCLNRGMQIDLLNENFELIPYNGLRKPHADDEVPSKDVKATSEIFRSIFFKQLPEDLAIHESFDKEYGSSIEDDYVEGEDLGSDGSVEDEETDADVERKKTSQEPRDFQQHEKSKHKILDGKSATPSAISSIDDVPSITDYFNMYYQSKMRTSAFADMVFDVPKVSESATEEMEELRSIFHGEPNIFVVEIFALRKEVERRETRHFLEATFECYPDLDYCAILLPFSHPALHFLDYFVRVPLRCNKDFPMTLYVTHRAAFLGEMKSREAGLQDRGGVQRLLETIPKSERILTDFDDAVKDRSTTSSYVFLCNDTIIGLAVLCAEKSAGFIKRRYHVEDYVSVQNILDDAYGRLMHFVLMPIFSIHQHSFFLEIMRLSGLTVLYYRLHESAVSALTRSHPLATCLHAMMPVKPRTRIEYKYRGYVENDQCDCENCTEREVFSLFMMTPSLATMPRSIVEMKIVIVGASDCGVASAEYLSLASMQNFVQFANITLISPNGLPFENKRDSREPRMIPFKGRYCHEYRHLVAARAWINVVYGTVIGIHRKGKHVTVMNQGNITYDYLILTCGLQYQKPIFEEELLAQKRGELTDFEVPWNCLTVNDDTEASAALEKIRLVTMDLKVERAIVFYGHNIDCYCALHGLLEFGVKGSWITLIEPPLHRCDTHDSVFFNDCEIDVKVMNEITRSGVNVLLGWNIINWTLKESEEGQTIESIVLESKGVKTTVHCDVLFAFHEKTINMKTFLAICRAGLVFDGQLVIDPECRTNDPSIFAAGTMTKYSRKFYVESWQHRYYNSIEIGERGKLYLTLPIFRAPTVVACILPGGYHYLHVRKPGKKILRKIAIRHDFYGEVLLTGSCSSDIGYFRIRLNLYNTVETVTCFSKKSFEVQHMVALYGKHESMLNELKIRFLSSLISDFFAYFREPWATAIFYDKFDCLRLENRATLLSRTAVYGDSLIDDCANALIKSKWEAISKTDRRHIESKYAGSIYHQELEENLMDFLRFCEDDLPMYCTPKKLRHMYTDIENSPLFNDL